MHFYIYIYYIYSETTCIQGPLGHVPIVALPCIFTSIKRPPLFKDHFFLAQAWSLNTAFTVATYLSGRRSLAGSMEFLYDSMVIIACGASRNFRNVEFNYPLTVLFTFTMVIIILFIQGLIYDTCIKKSNIIQQCFFVYEKKPSKSVL